MLSHNYSAKTWPEFAASTKIRSGASFIPFIPSDRQVELVKKIDPLAIDPSGQPVGTETLVRDESERGTGWTTAFVNYMVWRAAESRSFTGAVVARTTRELSHAAFLVRNALRDVKLLDESPELGRHEAIEVPDGGKILFLIERNDQVLGLRGVLPDFILFDGTLFLPQYVPPVKQDIRIVITS